MSLVHDQRKALPRKFAHFLRDHRKLLKRGHDDRLTGLQGFFELARGRVDVLDDAQHLLELAHRVLKLSIEYAPVGDNHDRIENTLLARVVKGGELVREPGNREAFTAPGGVLDQVALTGAHSASIGHESPHTIELLIARKDQEAIAG